MKFLAALLLAARLVVCFELDYLVGPSWMPRGGPLGPVVASVHSNSLHYYGWAPGKELLFQYQSQVLTGIPEISQSHWSGVKLNAKVHIQSYSDYSMRLRISEPEFFTINGEGIRLSEESGRVLREQESSESIKTESIPEEFKTFLEEPFLATMKSGVVESFLVSKNEPSSVTNIKKSILSQIQLDVAGTRRSQLETNHIQLPVSEEGSVSEQISYFTTMEESVQGECLTEYTIHKLPQWKINELEQAIHMEELKVKDFNLSESEAKTVCEGKPYYLITKTKNFEQCKRTPFVQMVTRDTVSNTDITSANEFMNVASTTSTYICGGLNQFTIRKIAHKRIADVSLTGYNTEEMAVSPSMVTMTLLQSKPISTRLNVPASTRVVKSLIFEFPRVEGQTLSHEETLNQEVVEKTQEVLGMRPLLPLPRLTEAPVDVIAKLNKEQVIPQIEEGIKKIAREVMESTYSCPSGCEMPSLLNTLANYMRTMSLSELEHLESKIMSESQSTGMKSMEKIFYDILSLVGTNPSTMLIVKKVKEGSLPTPVLIKVVSLALRNIRYPTQELMEELVNMIQSSAVKSNKMLYTSSMLQLSNLFYHAYVNPTTMRNNFPTKVFGVFGTKESEVLTGKFIPLLVEEIEQTESEHVRLSAILALGKTGHLKGLKTLVKVIEHVEGSIPATKESMIEARRTIAVNALKRVVKMNPTEMRPILMSIIVNPVESAEVRIAAVSVLPFSQPTTAELQKLAIRSWMEPSEQVSSFIVSTLRSLALSQVPELKTVGLKARSVLPLIKGQKFGLQYSHNVNFSSFIEYLRTLVNVRYELVNSKESLIPHKVSMKTVYYGPSNSMKFPIIEFSTYTYGMDFLLEKYLHFFSSEELSTPTIESQLKKITEELKLKTRELSTPFTFMHGVWGGIESSLYLDSEIVLESLEKLSKKFTQVSSTGHNVEFSHVGATQFNEASTLMPTETGLPVLSSYSIPVVYSVKGSLKMSKIMGNQAPSVTAKVMPVVSGKMNVIYGVVSPFTGEIIGSGVDMSLHAATPVEVEAKMSRGEIELSIRAPQEVQRSGRKITALHAAVMPFSFKKNLIQVIPVTSSSQMRKISNGLMREPMTLEIPQTLGLSGQLMYQSENKFTDLYSYITKIVQHSPLTVVPAAVFPSSMKMSSVRIQLHPSASEAKELNLVIRLSTKGMIHSLSKKQITEAQIGSEYPQIKSVLSQLEKANIVEITGMIKGSSGSQIQKINSMIVAGKKSEGTVLSAVEVTPIKGETYGVTLEGSLTRPVLKNRWSIEKILEEPLTAAIEGKLSFGKSGNMNTIKLAAQFEKTEELKREIRESPEYKKAMLLESRNQMLTPVSSIVRHQAASVDKVVITVQIPRTLQSKIQSSSLLTLVDGVSKTLLVGNLESEKMITGTQGVYKVEARAERTSQLVQIAKVMTPTREIVLKNLRLMGVLRPLTIFPTSILSSPIEIAALKLTGNHVPATCRVEPSVVRTFDNMTLSYKINDCEHVLLMDGSKHIPVAITTKTVSGEKKMVKILSGITEAKIVPEGSSLKVLVNGEQVHPIVGKVVKKSVQGKIAAMVMMFQDGVVSVHVPEQGITVLSNGVLVEVVAPQLLKSRAVGLCGDMNGERSADLKTPGMCVMRPHLAALSYLINKSGSASGFERCSGIPTTLKTEFQTESAQCARETVIPTPVSILAERISILNRPVGMTHVVEKQSTKLCISKQMVKTCLSKPLSIKQKSVEFSCVSHPSMLSRSLEKRALAGESLIQEIGQLPTVFRKVEFEPVACKSEMSSISL